MNKIIRYSGSKIKYTDFVNKFISYSDKKIYVEPFLGSGAIFLNLSKNFDKYIINDIDRNIVRIFKSIKEVDFDDFSDLYNKTVATFGKLNTKEGYYSFRSWFNEKHWNTETTEEGIYLIFLANCCINSMMRFGKDGFNQGCGMRDFTPSYTMVEHEMIKKRLSKTEILNEDFLGMEIPDNSLIFLDPPYFYRPSYSYMGFNDIQYKKFVDFLKSDTNNHILYTDVLHSDIDWKYVELRQTMRTTSPLKKSESTGNIEVLYMNYEYKTSALF